MRELSLNNCRLDKRYDIREALGRGSYAEIFVAKDTLASPQSTHTLVVIKALNVFLQDDLDADLERTLVENFQNEAVAIDRVRHPNIISRLGHGTARDLKGTVFHYLVLEYLAGGDLQMVLRREPLSIQRAVSYIEQVCAGLGYAHSQGIIHRDIKPQNILLTADHSTAKIADFGVARFSIADSPITRVGTNIYAPPEHSPLNPGRGTERLTAAADIYSLAKTVYTLLTRETPRSFANAVIDSLPEAAREEEWADELLRVVKRATAEIPAERHQTVEEFWGDLAGVRDIAADGEYSTFVRTVPQPHVSRGYTPIAPAMPHFKPTGDLPEPVYTRPVHSPPVGGAVAAAGAVAAKDFELIAVPIEQKQKPRRSRLRRLGVFAVAVALFTGALYGTATYMRGRGAIPSIGSFFTQETAVASTDIYLRPSPNTENDPIGLVTKNSKVKIVNSRDNWYQVDVVEQGRTRPVAANAKRGWINGKYLEFTSN